jgi:putative alpha-1,2-mannosidase
MLVPTFPSIQRPNGMLRIVPPNESFTTDRINGFGLSVPSHRQGQVFRLMPASGDAAALRADWSSRYDHSKALPYRYSVFLDDHDATAAFAPGRRSAICAVEFERPAAGSHENFLLLRPQKKGSLRIDGATVTGTDDYHGVTVYLHGEFDVPPARAGAYAAGVLDFTSRATRDSAEPVVAAVPAAVKRVRLRYAISYVSADQARRNLEAEIRDFDLERLAFLAAQLNSGIGDSQGSVGLILLAKDLDEGLAILRDVLSAPRFQDDKIALRKQQTLQAMKQRNDESAPSIIATTCRRWPGSI